MLLQFSFLGVFFPRGRPLSSTHYSSSLSRLYFTSCWPTMKIKHLLFGLRQSSGPGLHLIHSDFMEKITCSHCCPFVPRLLEDTLFFLCGCANPTSFQRDAPISVSIFTLHSSPYTLKLTCKEPWLLQRVSKRSLCFPCTHTK